MTTTYFDAFGWRQFHFQQLNPTAPADHRPCFDVALDAGDHLDGCGLVHPLAAAEKRWDGMMAPYKGVKVVTYHRSWPNFADHFGLEVIGYVEPKPGIAPSPSHTLEVIGAMKRQNVKIILVEPYFDLKTPNSISRETGAKVLVMPPSVGGEKEITDYIKLFDYDINLLTGAIKATK